MNGTPENGHDHVRTQSSVRRLLSSVLCPLSSDTGFTLIELVITIIILGFLSLILEPFYGAITHSPDPMIRQRAVALGQALMDEILAKKWDENTPSGGGPVRTTESTAGKRGLTDSDPEASVIVSGTPEEGAANRALWDDVDDYDGLNESNTFTDQEGNQVILTGYTRRVDVTYIPNDLSITIIDGVNPPGVKTPATDTKRIVITVTSPLRETFTLVAVVCNY